MGMSIYGMSDRAILREIGKRVRQKRLKKNITQMHLAESCGLNVSTIKHIETGTPFRFMALIQVLRSLKLLDELDNFIPAETISPIQLVKLKGKARRRASHKRTDHLKGDSE